MPKTKISEFSATPGNNTDIDGINIAEGCAPSGINDAIRELMAQLKDFQAGTAGDSFNGPVGTSTAAAGAFTTLSSTGNTTLGDASGDTVTINGATTFVNVSPTITPGTANGVAYLDGSKVLTTGSALTFNGSNTFSVIPATGVAYNRTESTQYSTWMQTGAGNANVFWEFSAGTPVRWVDTSAGELMRLTSTGLGIGTSSPGVKLDVYDTGNTTLRLSGSSGGGGDVSQIDFFRIGSNVTSSIKAIRDGGNTSGALTFYTASVGTNTEKMRLDSSGNLGLGVTPSAWNSDYKNFAIATGGQFYGRVSTTEVGYGSNFYRNSGGSYIYLTSAAASYQAQVGGVHYWFTAPSGTAGNAISWTQAMTLDASGNLQLGATSGSGNRLNVVGNGGIRVNEDGSGTKVITIRSDFAGVGPAINVTTNDPLLFQTNNTERARITSGGDLLVGTTNASLTTGAGLKFLPSSTASQIGIVGSDSTDSSVTYRLYSTGAAAYRFYVGYGGTVYATNTTISSLSDQRLKENIQDIDVGLTAVMSLKPRKFDWKAGKGKDIKGDRGFIAQEFEQVFPNLVDKWADPAPEGEEPYKSVRQDLIPVLVKAIQEQQAIINQLKARLDAANL